MQINEALHALNEGHTIWKVGYAKRVCEALGIPFDNDLAKRFYSEAEITGAHMYKGQEGALGVFGLDLSEYAAEMYGVKESTRQVTGRGRQARLYSESVRIHLEKLGKLTS